MNAYEGLARFYDGLTRDVDYCRWADWYESWFRESRVPVRIVLDLACGTGTLTCLLARRGYTTIGADRSAEMLAQAWEKAMELNCEQPVFLNQPAQELDLFGTIDACVSGLDSLNYIIDGSVLREAGFVSVQRFGGMDRRPAGPETRRVFYVCVNGEGGQTPGQMSEA